MFGKKISFFILIIMPFFLNHSIFAQNQRPQKVYRIIYVTKSNNWYLNQAKLWQKEVMKNSKNPEAWRNYYLATRYSRPSKFTPKAFKEKNKKMERILHDMGKYVPNSYEYYFLNYYHYIAYKKAGIELLQKAYQLHPDRVELYYFFTALSGKFNDY